MWTEVGSSPMGATACCVLCSCLPQFPSSFSVFNALWEYCPPILFCSFMVVSHPLLTCSDLHTYWQSLSLWQEQADFVPVIELKHSSYWNSRGKCALTTTTLHTLLLSIVSASQGRGINSNQQIPYHPYLWACINWNMIAGNNDKEGAFCNQLKKK